MPNTPAQRNAHFMGLATEREYRAIRDDIRRALPGPIPIACFLAAFVISAVPILIAHFVWLAPGSALRMPIFILSLLFGSLPTTWYIRQRNHAVDTAVRRFFPSRCPTCDETVIPRGRATCASCGRRFRSGR